MLVVVYLFDILFGNFVFWWFIEKYKVEIIDDNDIQYVIKINIEDKGNQSYDIFFDLLGYGLKL